LANFIPEDKISEIRNTVDIVNVISEAVLLKKSGRNYIGLCPFHSEKTPSFTVSPEKQIFHCFGCGKGGNVFTFLMNQSGFTFPEAVRTLANQYGVQIPERELSPEQRRSYEEREQLFTINRQALDFFCNALHKSAAGKNALNYLHKRGMTGETIAEYKIGYAPQSWDALLQYFNSKNIPRMLAEKNGLIISRKSKNGFYDRFRHRIIFPIFDSNQQVIGFGGRVMDDSLPKYLNSPETPLYNKSRSLYGLHRAKNACRSAESVYIVEGYFDLLVLHQHGIPNAVATLGTALTEEHVRRLRGLVGKKGKFILVYDSDQAGIKAARRSIEVFDKGFADAQILTLEAGHDPDSYISQFGPEKFINAAERAQGIVPFLMASAIEKHGLSIEGKIRIMAELQKPLSALRDDRVARSLYIKELAERIDVEESAVLEKIRDASVSKKTAAGSPQRKSNRMEQQIITMLLQYPDIIPELNNYEVLEYFEDSTLKDIGVSILKYEQQTADHADQFADVRQKTVRGRVSEIMHFIHDRDKEQIIAALASREDAWDINGCMKLINQFINARGNSRTKNLIEKRIQEAEQKGDHELLNKLLVQKQKMAVSKQKQKIALLDRKY
jgi:DNA primase